MAMNTAAIAVLVVKFLATNSTASYQMESMQQCESAKPPVATLYANLHQPVQLSCVLIPRNSVNVVPDQSSAGETNIRVPHIKTSIRYHVPASEVNKFRTQGLPE